MGESDRSKKSGLTFPVGHKATLGLCINSVGKAAGCGTSKEAGLTFPVDCAAPKKSGGCVSRVGETGGSAKFKKTFPVGHGAVLVMGKLGAFRMAHPPPSQWWTRRVRRERGWWGELRKFFGIASVMGRGRLGIWARFQARFPFRFWGKIWAKILARIQI
jgi:hypothetical protein